MMRMKKLCEYFIRYIFVFLILGVCFLEPVQVNAEEANTLRGLRQELKELQDQKRKNELRIKVKEGYQTNLMPFSLTGNYICKKERREHV